jgi:enamine deaminase RidA (YjgF/YER057c/UK114 family)
MSDRNEQKKFEKEVTNDLLRSKFTTELGQKARVERHDLANDRTEQLREVLADIGKDLQTVGEIPKGMQYRGSMSVHVFASDIMKTACFATINKLDDMNIGLVDGALRELTGSTFEKLGRGRKKLRSGF